MKKLFLLTALVGAFMPLIAQLTPLQVLKKSKENCLALNNGKYTLEQKYKYLSSTDTTVRKGVVVYEKAPSDSSFGARLWIELETKSFEFKKFYDGERLYNINPKEKKISIDTIKSEIQNSINGNVVKNFINFPVLSRTPFSSILNDSNLFPQFDPNFDLKDTIVILIELPESEDGPRGTEWIRYYFDASTLYPIAKEVHLMMDNEVQYEFLKITSFSYNKKTHSEWLSKQNWSADYETTFSQPYIRVEPLADGTAAPNWVGESFTGDSITFKNLNAKLYMVDFWYRSCLPCIKAMPFLDSMHKKYSDKGLMVIGLNPKDYDQKDAEIFKAFMQRRNVSYTLVHIYDEVAENYKVKSYPTLYFIDGNGKVVTSLIGYGKHLDEPLDNFINDYLSE